MKSSAHSEVRFTIIGILHTAQRLIKNLWILDIANLVSQYKSCSYDKFVFEPVEDQNMQSPVGDETSNIRNGVLTVQVSTAVSDGDSTMKNAITSKITEVFGKAPNQIADYVMYCLPPNTMSGIAYAYINSWLSIYSDQWCNYLSAQMHEVRSTILKNDLSSIRDSALTFVLHR